MNNSAYTNYGAVLSIRLATQAAIAAGREPGKNWSEIADNMYIPFDARQQYHPEWEGYTAGTRVKQADTILMAYPYGMNMSSAVRANDLSAYAPVTDQNGPAMTWASVSDNSVTLTLSENILETADGLLRSPLWGVVGDDAT